MNESVQRNDWGRELGYAERAAILHPDWTLTNRVHCWKNYISDEVSEMWDTFSAVQKFALYRQAEHQDNLEEWYELQVPVLRFFRHRAWHAQ